MNLNNIDISKLPSDIRREFKQLQVMHAEKKSKILPKMTFFPLLSAFGLNL